MQASFKEGKVTTLPAVNTIAGWYRSKDLGEKISPIYSEELRRYHHRK